MAKLQKVRFNFFLCLENIPILSKFTITLLSFYKHFKLYLDYNNSLKFWTEILPLNGAVASGEVAYHKNCITTPF